MSDGNRYSEEELACLVLEEGLSTLSEHRAEKIAARQLLWQLKPEVAQGLVNQSLQATQWEPEIRSDVWEETLPCQRDDLNP
jgi:hypothetical protein